MCRLGAIVSDMREFTRQLELGSLLKKKSHFLFGPRATGKSTLIRTQLPEARVYDLLDAQVLARLARRPKLLEEEALASNQVIAIDEIQRMPSLLNEVHRLIESKKLRFLLTGSSARKLKRGASNLLAGRAFEARLFPLCSVEIPEFDLLRYLNRGGLPAIYASSWPDEELHAYTSLYLREEIQAEALTRNVPAFARFLDVIALSNGEELNYQSLASDVGIPASTVRNYVEILEDTLLGFQLAAFTRTRKRKAIARAKHYLFDVGVVNTLCRRGEIRQASELFGKAFEHFVILEVRACLSYQRLRSEMHYWRSTSQFEVDLVIDDRLAIEIKATSLVSDKHLKGLRALKEEGLVKSFVVVSLDPDPRRTSDGISVLPWAHFLQRLWSGDLLGT